MKYIISIIYILVLISQVAQSERHRLIRRATCGGEPCQAPIVKSSPKNSTVSLGERKVLKCRVTGNPLPTVKWQKNDLDIDNEQNHYEIKNTEQGKTKTRNFIVLKSQISIPNLFNKDLGIYTCIATNNFGSVTSKRAYVTIDPENMANVNNIPGSTSYKAKLNEQCVKQINFTTCSQYLDPHRSIYTKNGKTGLFLNENLLKALAQSLGSGSTDYLSKDCKPFALPFLCYFNFPYCDESFGRPKKRSICRKDCIELSMFHCRAEFERAKNDDALQSLIPKTCDVLPKNNANKENCFDLKEEMSRVAKINKRSPVKTDEPHVTADARIDPRDNCYYGDGRNYRGVINKTESGRECLHWSRTNVAAYHEYLDGHNFCRNVGSRHGRPWCYVRQHTLQGMDVDVLEHCSVPKCAIPGRTESTSILYTVLPCLLFALALSLAIITLAWRRHKQHFYQSAPTAPEQVVPRVNPKIQELNREDLCDYRLLGDGNIGRVYTADFTGSKDGHTFTSCVAVKAIIEKATSRQIEDFVREAETRAKFKHENVVALVGVISKEQPLSLIYEYTEYGDLHEYLLRHSPNFSDAHANDDCAPLEFHDLLAISTQIASGMSYLNTHAFVHKDLAARNCLVADHGIIKISDFSGLCDQYAGDYYRVIGRPLTPVRWMSPESLSSMSFSNASDVWSYGIVLWEIFSYGSRPYFGLNNQQAMDCILDYKLLPCPEDCPNSIFSLMGECWIIEANSRPTFLEIYNRLKSLSDMCHGAPNIIHHPESSMHSLPSTHTSHSLKTREMTPNSFHNSTGRSHDHSLHSRQSSHHSVNSNIHGSIAGTIPPSLPSIPPSLMSMPYSLTGSSGYPISRPNGHNSLPRDGHYGIQHEERHSPHGRSHSLGHDGHYSLPRDGHIIHHPYAHTEFRPSSRNGGGYHQTHIHANGGHIPPASYISSLQSYPSSITGPPVSVFSRPHGSRPSSRETSVKSCETQSRHGNSVMGSHIYL